GPGGSSVTFRRCSGEDPSGEAECDAMALLDAPAGAPRPKPSNARNGAPLACDGADALP
ncbi:unnamed protein product, partial [Prorocentrum cordatum]